MINSRWKKKRYSYYLESLELEESYKDLHDSIERLTEKLTDESDIVYPYNPTSTIASGRIKGMPWPWKIGR